MNHQLLNSKNNTLCRHKLGMLTYTGIRVSFLFFLGTKSPLSLLKIKNHPLKNKPNNQSFFLSENKLEMLARSPIIKYWLT